MLNGRATTPIALKRSVRQGCPLLPLLFILAFDVLRALIQRALDTQALRGVFFPQTGHELLQNMFVDNCSAIIQALLHYAEKFHRILIQFGDVLGLKFAWEQTTTSFIPGGPPPPSLSLLPWTWENNENASKIIGISAAQTIAMRRLEAVILAKIESKLNKFKPCCLTLAARIVVANGLVMGWLWFLLIMWAGEASFLRKLQKLVDNFVWTGRSLVRIAIVSLPIAEGGLGQICIADQYKALSGSIILWVSLTEQHPLRGILQGHITQVSQQRWGTPDPHG